MPQAVRFDQYGGTEVLQVLDIAAPTVGPGQVRLRVRAAGVNPIDWKTLQGLMAEEIPLQLPAGLGSDVAGVVDQVGEGVTDLAVGDAVLGRSVTPSFAEYALAVPADLIGKPEDLDWVVAGTLAGAGGTAYTVLRRLDLQPGQTLLIHAAAGGVGTFAVQLAVARGVRVIGRPANATTTTCAPSARCQSPTATGWQNGCAPLPPTVWTLCWTPQAAVRFRCRSS
jgi:NADPH:quinone reductase-like Zn-dependent oxidoreductase